MMSHSLDIKGNNIIHDFDPFISFYNPENDHTLSNNYFLTRKHHMKLALRIVKFNEHLVQNDTHITGWSGIKFFLEFNTSLFKHRRTIHRKKPLTAFGRLKPSIFFFSHNLYYLSSRFMRYRNLLVKVKKTYYHNITFFRQVRPLNRYLFFNLFLKLHHLSFRLPLWIKAIYKKRYILFLYYLGFRISVYKRALIKPLDGPKPWKAFFFDPFKIRNLMHRNHKRKHRARRRVHLLNHYLNKRKHNWKTTYHLKTYTPEFRAQTKLIIQAFKSNHGTKRLPRTVSYRLVNYIKRLGKKHGFFMRLRRLLRNYFWPFPKLQYHRRIKRNKHLDPKKLRTLERQRAIVVKNHLYTNGVISLKPSILSFNSKSKKFKRDFSHFKWKKRIPRWLKPKRYRKRRIVPKVYYLRKRRFSKKRRRIATKKREFTDMLLKSVLKEDRLRPYLIKFMSKKPFELDFISDTTLRVKRIFYGYNKRLNRRLLKKQIVIIRDPVLERAKVSKKRFTRYNTWIARWKLMNKLVRAFYVESLNNINQSL
jgi:hypothetical protein